MHVMIVADGRSPIARRWVQTLQALNHRVTLVSTYPCEELPGVEAQHVLPVAFAGMAGSQARKSGKNQSPARKAVSRYRNILQSWRYRLAPFTLPGYGRQLRELVKTAQPDLVHALRIPFEGMLASYTPDDTPLAVSIWGNDLTLHAHGSRRMADWTRRTLQRANGLHADAQRDLRLAQQWGLRPNTPTLEAPGSGGVDIAEINRVDDRQPLPVLGFAPSDRPLVVNPRGFRPGSVRNDVFFQAIPLVLQRMPNALFACAGMQAQEEALEWVRRLHIESHVVLMPYLSQPQLWNLYHRAPVMVSISSHDGTPNSLLEAMAAGCFPIAGDIESLREWITPGINGLLVEPTKPQGLAEALLLALNTPTLRQQAAEINLQLVRQRADILLVRSQIEVFYQRLAT